MLKVPRNKPLFVTGSLYLMGEYYFSKNQKQKAKEFYEKIIASENTNLEINKEAQKRLNRDFSE